MKKQQKQLSAGEIKQALEAMGWCSLDEHLWQRLDDFKSGIVFLAPPLDTVPSPGGNAIYTIVQDLVTKAPCPCLILSIWPEGREPERCELSDSILYCKDPFQPVWFEDKIPYTLKKAFWGTGRPELLGYARKAARLLQTIGCKTVVVEDMPALCLPFQRLLKQNVRIFLHQHINAPLSVPTYWWQKIQKILSGIIFVAQRTLVESEKRHGKIPRASVVYNGVDLSHYDPARWTKAAGAIRERFNIGEKEIIALYVGRMVPGKGGLELAQAFVNAAVPGTKLMMVGDLRPSLFGTQEFIDELQRLASANMDKVLLAGNISQTEIPAWYQAADLVAVPSIQAEGLPKVVTEALAMGKPVLASDRGGTFELIKPGQNGWLLEDPKDIEKFSNQLQGILQNRKNISQFGKNAFIHDRPNLSVERCAKDFYDFVLEQTSNTQTTILNGLTITIKK